MLLGKQLLVANVGDSRAVISRNGRGESHERVKLSSRDGVYSANKMVLPAPATALSNDHKPNRTDERERIEQAGGSVMWAGGCPVFRTRGSTHAKIETRKAQERLLSLLQAPGELAGSWPSLVLLGTDF